MSQEAIGTYPQTVPQVTFKTRQKDESGNYEWKDVSTEDLFSDKKVVLFALPGAFTPTCTSNHLPTYEAKYQAFKDAGVDEVYCLSVNDTFVMNKWAENLDVEHVQMIPDGSAEFTRKMGMLVKKDNLGFGMRSWRYSMLVDDGKIVKIFVEPGFEDDCQLDPYEVSDADTMLHYLESSSKES